MKRLLFLLLAGILSGCEQEKDILQATIENPCVNDNEKLCVAIPSEGHCNTERNQFIAFDIVARRENRKDLLIRKLDAGERYLNCMEVVVGMEFIDPKVRIGLDWNTSRDEMSMRQRVVYDDYARRLGDRRSIRLHSLRKVSEDMDAMLLDHKGTDEPGLLYWFWTREGDKSAAKKLIQMYSEGERFDYRVTFALAQFYSKSDMNKARDMMVEALENIPELDYRIPVTDATTFGIGAVLRTKPMHIEILETLALVYYKQKNETNLYVIMKILELNGAESVKRSTFSDEYEKKNMSTYKDALSKAERIHDYLSNGQSIKGMLSSSS